jgi:hypothetical protein
MRRVLPNVCKIWRSVIYSIGHLWREITLSRYLDGASVEDDPYIWGKYAERAGDLPLDIVWDIMTTKSAYGARRLISVPKYTTAFNYFIEKAPFCRWRSLRLTWIGDHEDVFRPALQTANFTGLQILVTWPTSPKLQPVLEKITRTASNLQKFECLQGYQQFPRSGWTRDLSGVLSRISTLKCPEFPFDMTQPIPSNITRLELNILPHRSRSFLQVSHLDVKTFDVYRTAHLQFPNVKVLRVNGLTFAGTAFGGTLTPPASVLLGYLPKLEILIYNSNDFSHIDEIKALHIQEIRFTKPFTQPRENTLDPFSRLIQSNRYTLFAAKIVFDVPITVEMIHSVRDLYRSAKHLTFSFRREAPWGNWALVKNLIVGRPGNKAEGTKKLSIKEKSDGGHTDRTHAWPYLQTLAFQFAWEEQEHDHPYWNVFLRDIMDKRGDTGLKLVTCVWSDGVALCSETLNA